MSKAVRCWIQEFSSIHRNQSRGERLLVVEGFLGHIGERNYVAVKVERRYQVGHFFRILGLILVIGSIRRGRANGILLGGLIQKRPDRRLSRKLLRRGRCCRWGWRKCEIGAFVAVDVVVRLDNRARR
jgi:hypothetical protein